MSHVVERDSAGYNQSPDKGTFAATKRNGLGFCSWQKEIKSLTTKFGDKSSVSHFEKVRGSHKKCHDLWNRRKFQGSNCVHLQQISKASANLCSNGSHESWPIHGSEQEDNIYNVIFKYYIIYMFIYLCSHFGWRIRLNFRPFSLCYCLQPLKTMARHSTRLSAVVLLAVACLAFQAITQAFVATSLNRRDALQAAGFAAATLGSQAVWADAQGEPVACLTRYGPQILQLKGAVDKGDMEAVLKKEPKFKLLNSYWRRSDPATYEKYVSLTDELLTAADEGKKDVVQKLYSEYTSDSVETKLWSSQSRARKIPWPWPPMVPARLSFLSERRNRVSCGTVGAAAAESFSAFSRLFSDFWAKKKMWYSCSCIKTIQN